MNGHGGNLHSLRDLPGTYEKSGLDGRACRAIYEDARQRIDWQAMPPHEREFAQRLGVGP